MNLAPIARDQNSFVKSGVNDATACLEWLVNEGFTVLGLDVGAHSRPLILIQTCARCAWLREKFSGFVYKLFPVAGSRAAMNRVDIFGCRVEWVERGN